jgi:hypothetical protein
VKLKENAIGVFDSGVGGLTVAKQIFKKLPSENVVYFGDTARTPYGPRSAEIVRKFSVQNKINRSCLQHRLSRSFRIFKEDISTAPDGGDNPRFQSGG